MKKGLDYRGTIGRLARVLRPHGPGRRRLGLATLGSVHAEDAPARHRGPHARPLRTAEARPLTVRRHFIRAAPGPALRDDVYAPSLVRRWNDPNLDSFGGWRLGGDNFYGDGAGDTITRGNAALGMISGYGPANGGYGGPHFDSVGGFHNGPGPDAEEDADYASGSISRPDYGDSVPHYPSVRERAAALTSGTPFTAGAARVTHTAYAGQAPRPAFRAAPAAPPEVGAERDAAPHYLREDDLMPDLDLDF